MRVIGSLPLEGPSGEPVDLRRTLASHGVAELAPNRLDTERWVLETTLALDGAAHTLQIAARGGGAAEAVVSSSSAAGKRLGEQMLAGARRLLRLEEDLSGFYARAAEDPLLAWVARGAGRMVRSPSVFEDVVKTVCTTNCSWSATVRMTDAIVAGLGAAAPDGRRAFPTPAAMAQAPEDFYEQTARCGYRGAYLRRLAADAAAERLDLEQLQDPELPDEEVEQRLLALPGVGPYAAAHVMLTGLGRYHRLILDSWTRPTYARLNGRAASDKTIVRRFRRYGPYAGLAFWMLLTEGWVEP